MKAEMQELGGRVTGQDGRDGHSPGGWHVLRVRTGRFFPESTSCTFSAAVLRVKAPRVVCALGRLGRGCVHSALGVLPGTRGAEPRYGKTSFCSSVFPIVSDDVEHRPLISGDRLGVCVLCFLETASCLGDRVLENLASVLPEAVCTALPEAA